MFTVKQDHPAICFAHKTLILNELPYVL